MIQKFLILCLGFLSLSFAQTSLPSPSLPPKQFDNQNSVNDINLSNKKIIDEITSCYKERSVATDRLSCYDQIVSSVVDVKDLNKVDNNGIWQIEQNNYKYVAGVSAIHYSSGDSVFSDGTASLFFRCENSNLNTFVVFGDKILPVNVSIPVGLSFDRSSPTENFWTTSDSGAAVGLWSSIKTLDFLSILSSKQMLILNLKNKNNKNVQVVFDVSGLNKIENSLKKTCNL